METQTALESNRRIKRAVDARESADRFVDVKQAAALLHVTEASIRRYLTLKKLKRYKVGKGFAARTLLDRQEVLSLIREA
jgi:hypothetical protein